MIKIIKTFTTFLILFSFLKGFAASAPKVLVGADNLFSEEYVDLIKSKKIGLITNHTAHNAQMQSTIDMLKSHSKKYSYKLVALFAPEHGINGACYASENVIDEKDEEGIPIYSLHGKTKRPTAAMLKDVNLLIFDIQDVGARPYTYVTTLFYAMEEAAKYKIPVVVLDRPNPINGIVVDGPMLDEKWRSMIGYINVPYCHGMTVGELASFFKNEYKIDLDLHVVPMKGWQRWMTFHDTGLSWIPTSPNIPEATTVFYYPITGILGDMKLTHIGTGYNLPFKIVGAPWIDAKKLAKQLNSQRFPGVSFQPFYFRPFHGRFVNENCQGVLIVVTDPLSYKPVSTQYLIIGMLKSLYPEKFKTAIESMNANKSLFCKINGCEEIVRMITEDTNIVWKLKAFQQKERAEFLQIRKKYLIPAYSP